MAEIGKGKKDSDAAAMKWEPAMASEWPDKKKAKATAKDRESGAASEAPAAKETKATVEVRKPGAACEVLAKKEAKAIAKEVQSVAASEGLVKKKSRFVLSKEASASRQQRKHKQSAVPKAAHGVATATAASERDGSASEKAISVSYTEGKDGEASYTADSSDDQRSSISSDSESPTRTPSHANDLSSEDDRDSLLDELQKHSVGHLHGGDPATRGPRRSDRKSRNPRPYLTDCASDESPDEKDLVPYTPASTRKRQHQGTTGAKTSSKAASVSKTSCAPQVAACAGGDSDDEEPELPVKRIKIEKGRDAVASDSPMQTPEHAPVPRLKPGLVTPPSASEAKAASPSTNKQLNKIKARLEELRLEENQLERAKLLREMAELGSR